MDIQNIKLEILNLVSSDPKFKIDSINFQKKILLDSLTNSQYFYAQALGSILPTKKRISGAGASKNLTTACIKALAELGENYIFETQNLSNREGLAAGFLCKTALERAKFESLERDAFLYHWSQNIPFKLIRIIKNLKIYELECLEANAKCVLVTNFDAESECIIFGIAAGKNSSDIIFRAHEEFLRHQSLFIDGQHYCMNDQYLKNLDELEGPIFHHIKSKNPICRSRFLKLCTGVTKVRNKKIIKWTQQQYPSPIRFLNFVQASSPLLNKMTYFEADHTDSELYHPFW